MNTEEKKLWVKAYVAACTGSAAGFAERRGDPRGGPANHVVANFASDVDYLAATLADKAVLAYRFRIQQIQQTEEVRRATRQFHAMKLPKKKPRRAAKKA